MIVTRLIYTDLHIGSGNFAWPKGYAGIKHGKDTRVLGDFEFKNVRKHKISELTSDYMDHLSKSKEAGTINIAGNHEVRVGKRLCGVYELLDDEGQTLYVHGHRVVWSQKKSDKWENREAGSSWWRVLSIRAKNGGYKESKHKSIPMKLRDQMADYAKQYNAKRIVMGHEHFHGHCIHKGVEHFVCGRGESKITFEVKNLTTTK